jgi:hypothetical protein
MAGGCRAIDSGFRGIRIGHGSRPRPVRRRTSFDRRHRSAVPAGSTENERCAVGEVVHHGAHSFEELRFWARCELSIDVTAPVLSEHAATSGGGRCTRENFWQQTAESGTSPRMRPRKTMKIESLTLSIILLFAVLFDCGIGSASATDFCIELTRTEINHMQERRGDANACAGDESSDIKNATRDLARSNANNAIASQCLNDVTLTIGQQACARIGLVANTSPNNLWTDFPPAAKPNADSVRYIGRGVGGARA